jgi:hypothetical protein
METSTTSTFNNSFFDTTSDYSLNNNSKSSWLFILLLFILFGIIYYFYIVNTKQENMSLGLVTQLLSQDQQDQYLTGGPAGSTDVLATGNFMTFWNYPSRNGGNRANYSKVTPNVNSNFPTGITNNGIENDKNKNVNVPSLLKNVKNTPFPRINPKSTVSTYPAIKEILINQKENEQDTKKQLEKKDNNKITNLNSDANLNTLQSALINSCKSCKTQNCDNCPICLNHKNVENFDSGIFDLHQTIPNNLYDTISKKLINNKTNYPLFIENTKECFDNMINLDDPLRASTNGCDNCPQSRCVNCPHNLNLCKNSLNCPLGYPCETCKKLDKIKEKKNSTENYLNIEDNNTQCPLNKNNSECVECVKQCSCRLGDCPNCSECLNNNCKSCPNNRCYCLMGRCSDCDKCKNNNCSMCNKKNNKENNKETYDTVGFDRLCPCSQSRCNNCQKCRNGNCETCPKNTSTFIDLASNGTWHGGYRLGTNWNEATTGPNPININNGLVYYPDSYVGSYFINPKPDIVYPYAVIPPSRTVAGMVIEKGK